MHAFEIGMDKQTLEETPHHYQYRCSNRHTGMSLRALAAVMLTLATAVPYGIAQQLGAGAKGPDKSASVLPAAPVPVLTEPLDLRQSARDFSKPASHFTANPIKAYLPTTVEKASFINSMRLEDLVKNGKIYLSLSDAIALAIENNYDIAIARYNLDIADTDLLRARAGSPLRGVDTAVITGTEGGTTAMLVTGGGPGGAGSGSSGLVLSTNGAGPAPELLDPSISATLQFDRQTAVPTSFFTGGTSSTNTYNFSVSQGFVTGTNFQVAFNNDYAATSNGIILYSPELNSSFKATLTQHLLQGAGLYTNKRFMYQAINDRRITDSSFRQQILYTVNQVENIYWDLVSAYEDVQAKQRALEQSTQLESDTRSELEIGSVPALDLINAQSTVANDKQALRSSQNSLSYQQQIIKQAIVRNLNDPALVAANVVPTDRVSLEELPEETEPVDALVQEAFSQRPELEQAVLQLKNNEITLRGARNALLPTLDAFAYLGGAGVGGAINPNCDKQFYGSVCTPTNSTGWGTAAKGAFNNTAPDKGIGFNLQITIRNRTAQADQARSLIEYRQSELRIEQLYTQIRMQVINAQLAISNDRDQVKASIAAQEYAKQNLDAEVQKLRVGASTTTNVLLQQRSLATAENNLIAANAAYARDRAGLYQTLASTLQHYNISLTDAATGKLGAAPAIPGLVQLQSANAVPAQSVMNRNR